MPRLNGLPSPDARGDDLSMDSDEEGIVVDDLLAGGLGHLVATASRHGGYLQGWVDFNGDSDFDDPGERIITNELLLPGPNDLFFPTTSTIEADRVFARFRYGEYGIDSVTGAALIGEVEDYELNKVAPVIVVLNGPDFDDDGDVDGFDFLSWQRGFGMVDVAIAADGDSNNDNNVDGVDFADWSAEFGSTGPLASTQAAPGSGDFDEDGDTDGFDLLAWQIGFGSVDPSVSDGDGDESHSVDSTDLAIWSAGFGEQSEGSPLAATASNSSQSESPSIPVAEQSPALSSSEVALRSTTTENPVVSSNTVAIVSPNSAKTVIAPANTATLAGDTSRDDTRPAALASVGQNNFGT